MWGIVPARPLGLSVPLVLRPVILGERRGYGSENAETPSDYTENCAVFIDTLEG